MTGFGRGTATAEGFNVTVETKTLNSRYLDVSVRLPQELQHHEFDIKEEIQKRLSRGKAHVNIYLDRNEHARPKIRYNGNLIRSYSEMLREMKEEAGIDKAVTLQDLLHFDDIFESREPDEEDVKTIWNCTLEALSESVTMLNQMRSQEGQELKNDLEQNIKEIQSLVDEVNKLSDKRTPEVRDKLQKRIRSLIDEEKVDPDRLEMEIALLVDKMDVNEEIIRLKSHLKFFLEALDKDETVGRRLNFLCQEVNRELNTIGAKCNDSTISHHIVLGKEKLEKIREQVQNIE